MYSRAEHLILRVGNGRSRRRPLSRRRPGFRVTTNEGRWSRLGSPHTIPVVVHTAKYEDKQFPLLLGNIAYFDKFAYKKSYFGSSTRGMRRIVTRRGIFPHQTMNNHPYSSNSSRDPGCLLQNPSKIACWRSYAYAAKN